MAIPLLAVAGVSAAASLGKSILGHNSAVDAWEAQVKAAHQNTVSQQTSLKTDQLGQKEQYAAQRRQLKIASLEEQGRQVAASGASGITGKYVDRKIQSTANKAGRDIMQSKANEQAMDARVAANINQMWRQYENNAAASKPDMDWGAALINAGVSGISSYVGGSLAGAGAATSAAGTGTVGTSMMDTVSAWWDDLFVSEVPTTLPASNFNPFSITS